MKPQGDIEEPEIGQSESQQEMQQLPALDLLAYLLFPVFLFAFLLTLVVFEILQRVAFCFGSRPQQFTAVWLSHCLKACLGILNTRIELSEPHPGFLQALPRDQGYILVSTHQSLFDIPILASIFAKHYPRFVAKQELGKGIPSVSYNLRVGGAALIDRKNPRQAIPEIKRFGSHLMSEKFVGVIFPEGTRSRNGQLGPFHAAGLTMLLNAAPDATVIPVVLRGTWALSARKYGPIPRNTLVQIKILPAINRTPQDTKSCCAQVLEAISNNFALSQPNIE